MSCPASASFVQALTLSAYMSFRTRHLERGRMSGTPSTSGRRTFRKELRQELTLGSVRKPDIPAQV